MLNIIENLNEKELEFTLQNAKQQVEVINQSLKTTESRTKLLIAFLVVSIIFFIGIVLLQDISLYIKICANVIILFNICMLTMIVHCCFGKETPSQVAKTENILEFIEYYKRSVSLNDIVNNRDVLQSTKKDILHCILTTTIPNLNALMQKRANIFNNSVKYVFTIFAIINIIICILSF